MRVLLINPGCADALASEAGAPPEEGTGAYPPLGLLYLQAAVEAAGDHRVDVVDGGAVPSLRACLGQRFADRPPDLVGVSAMTPNLPGVVRVVRAARQLFPMAPVVIGGPHTDLFPRETAALDGVDYVLAGEAEVTLPQLVDQLEKGAVDAAIPGLLAADGSVDGLTDARPLLDGLDHQPPPDRTRLPIADYRGLVGDDATFTTLVTSRGCPHRCTFCSTPREHFRQRSVEAIVEEIEDCVRLGIRHVYFLDDNFPVGGRRLAELCDALCASPEKVSWSCRTAAAGLTRDGLQQMKRAGCQRVQIGVETGSDEGLAELGKGTSVEQIRQTFGAARDVGMETMAYFMLGLPHERSPGDVRQMIRFAREIRPTYAMFNVLTLYPGTELLRRAAALGLTDADVWRRFAAEPHAAFEAPVWDQHMDREVLADLQAEAYRSFYWRPGTVLRMARGGDLRRKARAGLHMLWSRRR